MQQYAAAQPPQAATCLIIEDSQFDQRMMSRVVGRVDKKMQIEVAGDLQTAREMLRTRDIALILLDNRLPDGIGANFAMELASNPRTARTPVIMVSDWPTPFMWEKAASAGVMFVLNKAEFGVRYVEHALKSGLRKRVRAS